MKYGISNTPVRKREVLNKIDEIRLELPEYATDLPKSLRKLYTKENPGELESTKDPPVYIIIDIGRIIRDCSIPIMLSISKISCQFRFDSICNFNLLPKFSFCAIILQERIRNIFHGLRIE